MDDKKKEEQNNDLADWETLPDYYENESGTDLILEAFIEHSQQEDSVFSSDEGLDEKEIKLKRTVEDIKQVRTLSVQGFTVTSIAEKTGFAQDYVTLILMTIEGYPEDNDVAAAHLVLLG